MAAPVVKATSTHSSPSTGTNHIVTLPSVSAGDVLLVIAATSTGAGITGTSSANWQPGVAVSTYASVATFTKRATGSETTVTITTAPATRISATVYVLSRDAYIGTATTISGAATAVDPTSANAVIAGLDTTYLCIGATVDGGSASSAPSGYSGLTNVDTSGVGGATLFTAYKYATVSTSDNPGTFGYTATVGWDAITIPISNTHPFGALFGESSYVDSSAATSRVIYSYPTHPIGETGDTILVLLASNVAISGVTGFTLIGGTNNGTVYVSAYYKTVSSAQTSITVTSSSGYVSSKVYLLRGAGALSIATAIGSSVSPDSPSVTVTGSKANTVSLSFYGTPYNATLSNSTWPTGYDLQTLNGGAVSSNRALVSAAKLVASTTEDPSNFVKSTSTAWAAATLIAGYDSLSGGGVSATPTQGAISLVGLQPTVYIPAAPSQGVIAITGQAPGVFLGAEPSQGTIAITGQTPGVFLGAVPEQAEIAITGNTPDAYLGSAPTQAEIVITGLQPHLLTLETPLQGSITVTGLIPSIVVAPISYGDVTGRGFTQTPDIEATAELATRVEGRGFSTPASIVGGMVVEGAGFTSAFSSNVVAEETAYVTGQGFSTTASIILDALYNVAVSGRSFTSAPRIEGGAAVAGESFESVVSISAVAPTSFSVSGSTFTSAPLITAQGINQATITGRGFVSGIVYSRITGRSFTTAPVLKSTFTADYAEAFVMNLVPPKENLYSVSRYQNYPFLHIARIGNVYYGVKPDGIYTLSGEYDGIEDIQVNGTIQLNEDDLSAYNSQNIPYIYLNGEDDYEATAFVDDVEQPTFTSGFGGRRVRLARGSKGRYWYFKIGGIKSLYGVEYRPEKLARKVK